MDEFQEITTEQLMRTFETNVYSYFWTTKAALAHLGDGALIINTSSINGLRGNKSLIDYAATKGAILALTYSLAQSFEPRGIRVNCVAPAGLEPVDPGDDGRGCGRGIRRPRADGAPCAPRRDRPLLCLLCLRSAVQLLLQRGPRPDQAGRPCRVRRSDTVLRSVRVRR